MTVPPDSQRKPIEGSRRKAKDGLLSGPQDQRAFPRNGANIYDSETELDQAFEDAMRPRNTAAQGAKAIGRKNVIPIIQIPTVNYKKRSTQDLNDSVIEDWEHSTRSTSRRPSSEIHNLHTLRRSPRDAVPMSGPNSYNPKWHPVDVLKKCQPRKRKPLNADAGSRSLSVVIETSKIRTTDGQQLVNEDVASSRKHLVHEDVAHPNRRRSGRVTYSEAPSMIYDMKHHPSYDNFHRPIMAAKRLEKKRLSMLVPSHQETPALEESAVKDVYCDEEPIRESGGRRKEGSVQYDGPQPCNSREEDGIDVDECTNGERRASSLPTQGHGEEPSDNMNMIDDNWIDQPDDDMEEPQVPSGQLPPTLSPAEAISTTLPLGITLDHSPNQRSLQGERNPYRKPEPLDWTELSDFDRRLYLIQKGTSTKGDALPATWSAVRRILSEEGLLFNPEPGSSAEEIEQFLQERYETIRLSVESFFGAAPEPVNKGDWVLYRIEGFDVYNHKKGVRYFKHTEDSIVRPVTTTLEVTIRGAGDEGMRKSDDLVHNSCPPTRLLDGHMRQSPNMVFNTNVDGDVAEASQLDALLLPKRSLERPIDLVATSQPMMSQKTQDMNPQELVDFLDMLSTTQTESPPPEITNPRPKPSSSSSSSSSHPHPHPLPHPTTSRLTKRRKRPTAAARHAHFTIFEDEDDDDFDDDGSDAYHRRKRLELMAPKSDHPVENMIFQGGGLGSL